MPFLDIENETDTMKIVFDDFFGRISFSPSVRTTMNLSYFRSYDNFTVPEQHLKYRNDVVFSNGQFIIDNDKILRYNIGNSSFWYNNQTGSSSMSDSINTFFSELALEMFAGEHNLEIGTRIKAHELDFYINEFNNSRTFSEIGVYCADKIRYSEKLILDGGLALTYITNYNQIVFSPGISAKYFLDDLTALQAGFGIDHQVMSSIWTNDFLYPFDFYIAPEENIAKEYSLNVSIQRYISDDYALSCEIFTRYSKDITSYPFEGVFSDEYHNSGDGRAKGIEMMFKKSRGKLQGLLSYSFLKSEEVFDDFIDDWRPGRFDRTHSVNGSMSLNFGRFDVNSSLSFGSGMPYGTEYEDRLPNVFSLNIALHSNHNIGNAKIRFFIEIMNITKHENITWRNEMGQETKSIGLLPMIGLRGEF